MASHDDGESAMRKLLEILVEEGHEILDLCIGDRLVRDERYSGYLEECLHVGSVHSRGSTIGHCLHTCLRRPPVREKLRSVGVRRSFQNHLVSVDDVGAVIERQSDWGARSFLRRKLTACGVQRRTNLTRGEGSYCWVPAGIDHGLHVSGSELGHEVVACSLIHRQKVRNQRR